MRPAPLAVTEFVHKATDRPFQLTKHHRRFLKRIDAAQDTSELQVHGGKERRMARLLALNGYLRLQGDLARITPKGTVVARRKPISRVTLAKIKNGANAIRWALQEYADHTKKYGGSQNDPDLVVAFLEDWQSGAVVAAPEWGEYRYWCTGEHE